MALRVSTLVLVMCILVTAMAVAPTTKAQLGLLQGLFGLLRIQGTVFCTANGQINGTSTPVFSNAAVQVQCGSGNVVSSGITNSSGVFSLLLDPIIAPLSFLLQNCNLVVTTPLSTCNATLPSVGFLASRLQTLGTTLLGFINIFNIIPTGFNFVQTIN